MRNCCENYFYNKKIFIKLFTGFISFLNNYKIKMFTNLLYKNNNICKYKQLKI